MTGLWSFFPKEMKDHSQMSAGKKKPAGDFDTMKTGVV